MNKNLKLVLKLFRDSWSFFCKSKFEVAFFCSLIVSIIIDAKNKIILFGDGSYKLAYAVSKIQDNQIFSLWHGNVPRNFVNSVRLNLEMVSIRLFGLSPSESVSVSILSLGLLQIIILFVVVIRKFNLLLGKDLSTLILGFLTAFIILSNSFMDNEISLALLIFFLWLASQFNMSGIGRLNWLASSTPILFFGFTLHELIPFLVLIVALAKILEALKPNIFRFGLSKLVYLAVPSAVYGVTKSIQSSINSPTAGTIQNTVLLNPNKWNLQSINIFLLLVLIGLFFICLISWKYDMARIKNIYATLFSHIIKISCLVSLLIFVIPNESKRVNDYWSYIDSRHDFAIVGILLTIIILLHHLIPFNYGKFVTNVLVLLLLLNPMVCYFRAVESYSWNTCFLNNHAILSEKNGIIGITDNWKSCEWGWTTPFGIILMDKVPVTGITLPYDSLATWAGKPHYNPSTKIFKYMEIEFKVND